VTLAAACGWSLVRSLVIALAAWPVCRAETNWLRNLPERKRRLVWWVLVIPFLCPELWAGYAWSGFAVRLAGTGLWNYLPASLFPTPQSIVRRDGAVDEVLLDLLLFLRAIPVGTLALYFAPPPLLSREARYCRDLAITRNVGQAFQPDFRLESLTSLPALGLVFLAAFQEFELASLIGRPAWTVWLFDAQVGGLALSESLRKTVLPVICQLAVVVPLAVLILTRRGQPGAKRHDAHRLSWSARCASYCAAISGVFLLLVVPACLVGQATFSGLLRVVQSHTQTRMLFHEIFTGLGYALTAALVSTFVVASLLEAARRSRWVAVAICLVAVPGLVGSLVLGLVLIQLLQQPLLRFAYKSPLSLGTGLVLFLVPRALLLRFLLWSSARPAGEHLARLLGESRSSTIRGTAGELLWQMRWRGEFWGVALLAYWGFFDLTTASLLAPVTIVSAPVMLYNQMHFGKNATLSALVLLTVLVPLAVFAVATVARRLVFRWFWR
jgi:ABC-type Fe3+ transport system permease subunit